MKILPGDRLNKSAVTLKSIVSLPSQELCFFCGFSLWLYSCLSPFSTPPTPPHAPSPFWSTSAILGFLRRFSFYLCRWPRTLAGITAYLQCTRNTHGSGIYPGNTQDERKAWRRCDRGGFWADDDYSRCQYANDVTRVLYMFNQVTIGCSDSPGVWMKYGVF